MGGNIEHDASAIAAEPLDLSEVAGEEPVARPAHALWHTLPIGLWPFPFFFSLFLLCLLFSLYTNTSTHTSRCGAVHAPHHLLPPSSLLAYIAATATSQSHTAIAGEEEEEEKKKESTR